MRIAAIANEEFRPAACPQAVGSLHSQILSTGLSKVLRPQEQGTAVAAAPLGARDLSLFPLMQGLSVDGSNNHLNAMKEVHSDLTALTHPAHRTQGSTGNAASRNVTSSLLHSCFSCVIKLQPKFTITSPSHVAAFSAAYWQARTDAHRLQLVEDISGAGALSIVSPLWVSVLPSKTGRC